MTFVVVFIKFIDFSIGGNIADKRIFYLCESGVEKNAKKVSPVRDNVLVGTLYYFSVPVLF